MRQASTEANREAVFEAMNAPRCKSFVKIEWDDDGAWRPLEDLDVGAVTEWGEVVEKKNYTNRSLTPIASDISFQVLSLNGRYSENAGTPFSSILRPNRKIRLSAGYLVPDEVVEEYEFPMYTGVIANGVKIEGGRLVLDITNTDDNPAPYFTDFWAYKYGEALYNSVKYAPVGYWVGTYDGQSQGEQITFRTVAVSANSTRNRVFYRVFNEREPFEAANTTSASWTELGNTINGYQVWTISAQARYIQIAVIPDGTTWSSGDYVDGIAVGLGSKVEFIYRQVFYLDTPSFPEPPAPEIPRVNCSGRDVWKRALEITALLPNVSTLSLDAIFKLVCNQVGIKYTATSISDLSALGARTLTGGIEKPYKIDVVADWIAQIGTQRGATSDVRYKVYLKYDEALRDQVAYIQPRALTYEAVFCFQSRYYLQLGDRSRNYDKKIYRMTAMSKREPVAAEAVLDTDTFTTPGTYTLSWTGLKVYKRVVVTAVTGNPVIRVTSVTGTSIEVEISGAFSAVTLQVSGSAFSAATPAAVGESLRVESNGEVAGQAVEVENPLFLDDAEAMRVVRGWLDEWGEPVNTISGLEWPYLHLTPETNDMAALWARFVFDDNLSRVLGRRYSWNYLAGHTLFDLQDTGLNFSDISAFKYDEDSRAQKHDIGFLYDMSYGPQAHFDPKDYEYLRDVEFTPIPPPPASLSLWSKCESQSGGLVPSEVGSDIHAGDAAFAAAKFGNGLRDAGTQYPYFTSAEWAALFPNPLKGTVEYWIKLTGTLNNNYSHFSGMDNSVDATKFLIAGDFTIGVTPYALILGTFFVTSPMPATWLTGELHHIALTWDFVDGLDGGSDTARLYFDGVQVGSTTSPNVYSTMPATNISIGRQWPNTNPAPIYVDNIKIWNTQKTDFSDRNTEGL